MPTRLAILGLDPIQRPWISAVDSLRSSKDIELVAVAHRSLNLAKDVCDLFNPRPPAFDDLRLLLKDSAPQVVLMDRPSNVGIDFITACINQDIGILSLGPPVENVAEAQDLAGAMAPRTHLLQVWPRLTDAFAFRQFAQGKDLMMPLRFVSASWLGMNHALAKTAMNPGLIPVRSLSVLAWDALATLIELLGMPTTVYASIRGTVGSGDSFSDISGACAVTMRFADEAVAALTLSDRSTTGRDTGQRELLLMGQNGSARLQPDAYDLRDLDGKLLDSGHVAEAPAGSAAGGSPLETLRAFLQEFVLPASPLRGWEHRLPEIASTMEALLVSHRTGQAESPERFRDLRR